MNIIECIKQKAGLDTQFKRVCKNEACKLKVNHNYFCKTKNQGHVCQINWNADLTSRIIGKSHTGLMKICSVLGLSSSINKPSYSEYIKYWKNLAHFCKKKNNQISCIKSNGNSCQRAQHSS